MHRHHFIGLLLGASALWAESKPATLFLVRHAERAGGTALEVPISEAGQERAQLLARMLGDAGITSILVSDALRTQQTAAPIAAKLKQTPVIVKGSDFDQLKAAAMKIPAGTKALFVRHSNELGPLVESLGGGKIASMADTEFDRMVIVTLLDGKAVAVSTLRYGR
jgi:phosphohistidine phosphatase SixA